MKQVVMSAEKESGCTASLTTKALYFILMRKGARRHRTILTEGKAECPVKVKPKGKRGVTK